MRFNPFYGNEIAVTYDDVCLVPQFSTVESRSKVDLTHGKLSLKTPIIAANMDTVTEAKMAIVMHKLGGLGIIHRFMSFDRLQEEVKFFYKEIADPYNNLALSIGTTDKSYDTLDYCIEHAKILCIDIAHGHSSQVISLIKEITRRNAKTVIIAGNVATIEGTRDLAEAGADIIKCGVGPGSMCTTRVVTGHGVPQLTVIDMCSKEAAKYGAEVIADGGIRNGGDAAKAFAAGAHYIMAGSLLAATDESPGETLIIDRVPYKQYRGMASFDAQTATGKDKDKIVPEGASRFKKCKGSAEKVIFQLAGGIRSALSYSGCHKLSEFASKAQFVRITSASRVEGEPHGLIEH